MELLKNRPIFFALLLFLVVAANFYYFGYLDHRVKNLEGDETEFNMYARNITQNNIYSMDGKNFSAWREPGYILFIVLIYKIFGTENIMAVQIFQAFFLWLTALLLYLTFIRYGKPNVGILSSIFFAADPYFGHLSARLLPEVLFTFFLGLNFYLIVECIRQKGSRSLTLVLFGLAFGWLTLIRLHVLYLPFLLALMGYIWKEKFSVFTGKNGLKFIAAFLVPIFCWIFFIWQHTGKIMIQDTRADIHFYVRAQRVQDSWPNIIYYGVQQVKNTFLGVREDSWWQADYRFIINKYDPKLHPKSESIKIILAHPLKYAFGNVIEFLKLISIYHAFNAPHFSKYFRLGVYFILYISTLWTVYICWKKKEWPDIVMVSLLFAVYNLVLVSCFNTEARYNLPFHIFYMIIGAAGIVIYFEEKNKMSN